MELGIFAKTFQRASVEECLEAVSSHGLECAHYNMVCSGLPTMPDTISWDIASQVKAVAAMQGVNLVAVSGTYNMIHPDETVREKGLRRLRVLAESCQAMGISTITLCTGTRDPDDKWRAHPNNRLPDAWRDLCAHMERALEIAEEYDLSFGIEPETANVVDSSIKARQFLDEMQSPRLSIVFDPANLFEIASLQEQRRLISEGLDLLAGRIIMAHAKDRLEDGTFCAAGKGVLDYPFFLQALHDRGFDGSLVMHGLEEEEVVGCVAFLREVF